MTLDNKTDIENEYNAKAGAIRSITPGTINSNLAGLATFVVMATEALQVLLAREALNNRALAGGDVDRVRQAVNDLASADAQVRSAIGNVQTSLPS